MAGRPIAREGRSAEPRALRGRRALDDRARRVRLADPVEQVAERLAVLGHPDGLERRAEQPDRVALEDAGVGQRGRQVERGLAAQAGEQALGPLLGDDRLDRLDGERLEVDRVRDRRVGHDRGRVRVDEDRPDALGAQRAAGLRPGVVELGGLADDDRPGPRMRTEAGSAARDGAAVSRTVGARVAACGPGVRHPRASGGARRGHEPVEHRERVERPGRALRVVLDRLDRLARVAKTLDGAVVEVDLADAEARRAGSESPTTWTSWFWAVTWTRPRSRSWTGWFAP